MKAFTIWQPWASLIMTGAKPFEFRPRSYLQYINHPKPGERIVIHAGARKVDLREVLELLKWLGSGADVTGLKPDLARPLLERVRDAHKSSPVLTLGAGLGTAVIGRPCNAADIFGEAYLGSVPQDSDRGDFNWAWPLSEIEPFEAPVQARGMQGFWNWPFKAEARAA